MVRSPPLIKIVIPVNVIALGIFSEEIIAQNCANKNLEIEKRDH